MYFDSIIFNSVQKLIQEPDNSWKLYLPKRINMISSEILSETKISHYVCYHNIL